MSSRPDTAAIVRVLAALHASHELFLCLKWSKKVFHNIHSERQRSSYFAN